VGTQISQTLTAQRTQILRLAVLLRSYTLFLLAPAVRALPSLAHALMLSPPSRCSSQADPAAGSPGRRPAWKHRPRARLAVASRPAVDPPSARLALPGSVGLGLASPHRRAPTVDLPLARLEAPTAGSPAAWLAGVGVGWEKRTEEGEEDTGADRSTGRRFASCGERRRFSACHLSRYPKWVLCLCDPLERNFG
jgi:hypothetical protein